MGTGRLVLIRHYANMMPAFYTNSVLIHLNDTGEISHEIGEAAFMSEMIKIIQGVQTAFLMETWLTVWDYKCSPNGIFTVCLTLSHYLCQWLLLLAAGRAVQLVRRRPVPTSAPERSLSLCWGFAKRCHKGETWAAVWGLEPAATVVLAFDTYSGHMVTSIFPVEGLWAKLGSLEMHVSRARLCFYSLKYCPSKHSKKGEKQVLLDSTCSLYLPLLHSHLPMILHPIDRKISSLSKDLHKKPKYTCQASCTDVNIACETAALGDSPSPEFLQPW